MSQYDTIIKTLGVPVTAELLENIQNHIHLMKISENSEESKEQEQEQNEDEKKAYYDKPIKGAKVPGFRKQVEYGEKKRIKP